MAKQLYLPDFSRSKKSAFGGSLGGRGNPKRARVIDTKRAMHVVLRSSLAHGELSFLRHGRMVENTLQRQAELFGVKLYDVANSGNHLHLLVKAHSRRLFQGFLRSLSGVLARKMLKAEKNSPWKDRPQKRFFDARPYTDVVNFGRQYENVKNYLMLNRVEMLGIPRQAARQMFQKIDALKKNGRLLALGFEASPT